MYVCVFLIHLFCECIYSTYTVYIYIYIWVRHLALVLTSVFQSFEVSTLDLGLPVSATSAPQRLFQAGKAAAEVRDPQRWSLPPMWRSNWKEFEGPEWLGGSWKWPMATSVSWRSTEHLETRPALEARTKRCLASEQAKSKAWTCKNPTGAGQPSKPTQNQTKHHRTIPKTTPKPPYRPRPQSIHSISCGLRPSAVRPPSHFRPPWRPSWARRGKATERGQIREDHEGSLQIRFLAQNH